MTAKSGLVRRIIVIVVILLFFSSLNPPILFELHQVYATPADEDANNGGTGYSDYNKTWYIDEGKTVTRSNQTINLNGDLIINSTGKLIMNNVTLEFNNSFNGQYQLNIKSSGTLELHNNSKINTSNKEYKFEIIALEYSSIILNSSEISGCGWDSLHPGLRLNHITSNSSIINMTFNDCYYGIFLENETSNLIIVNSTFSNNHIGIFSTNAKNIMIRNNNISSNDLGIKLINSSTSVFNSTIFNNTQWGVYSAGHPIMVYNNTYNKTGGVLSSGYGRVWQQYFLKIQVNDSVTDEPVGGALVTINNSIGKTEPQTQTDLLGITSGLNLTAYKILNNGTNISETPHNVTVEHPDYVTCSQEISISKNQDIKIKLTRSKSSIVPDYIIIEEQSGGGNSWVGARTYGVGEKDTYYCVGYNLTYGYVGELNASWSVTNYSAASVLQKGTSTQFNSKPILDEAVVKVSASFSGLTNETGLITIQKPVEDYVIIVDDAEGLGSWVGPHNVFLYRNETYYCAVYNNSIGYLYDRNASWICWNPYIGSVDPLGKSTKFVALAEGSTFVEATYTSSQLLQLKNRTGTINIKEYIVDQIIIRTKADNKGYWFGPKEFDSVTSVLFYCAGYNKSFGYIDDVEASWDIVGNDVGYLSPAVGSATELFITSTGEAHISAHYLGLFNRTGLLKFKAPLPDLQISNSDITFSPDNFKLEENIETTIGISIHNQGGPALNYVPVNVHSKEPPDGNLVLMKSFNAGVFDAYQIKDFNVTWKPDKIGTYIIIVFIDEADQIDEINENNNIAERTIEVIPFLPDLVKIEVEPYEVEVEAAEVTQFKARGFFEDDTSRYLESDEFTWSVTGGANINSTGHFYSLKAGLFNVTAYSGHITNTSYATVVPGPLAIIEVKPDETDMDVGDTKIFHAYGYDEYYNEIPVKPFWRVTGGGEIDVEGKYSAKTEGEWIVIAEVEKINGSAVVRISETSLQLTGIMIIPSKAIVVPNSEFKFSAVGVDVSGEEHMLAPFWTTTGGGNITGSGIFNATEVGRWTITAEKAGISATAEVIVAGSSDQKLTERFEDPRTGVYVIASFSGIGTIWINQVAQLLWDQKPPDFYINLDFYIEIVSGEEMVLNWAKIHVPYKTSALPAEYAAEEKKLKLYYWSGTDFQWHEVDQSSVDSVNKIVVANVTHLTIFAPMIDKTPAKKEEQVNYLNWILLGALIIGIIILIVVAFMFITGRAISMDSIVKALSGKKSFRPIKKIVIVRRQKRITAVTQQTEQTDDDIEAEE